MNATCPIIFIHYGKAPYLPLTLCSARASNPDKRVFLIGDDSNKPCVPDGCSFADYHELETASAVLAFDQVFQPIEGSRHHFNKLGGTGRWLQFVFRRWFLVAEFLRRENITSFWTFDSDTMVLAPLGPREKRFQAYDSTTQCRDCCLNGYVGSRTLVERYTRCMTELFKDTNFLDAQRKRLQKHAGLAFNEMDAFCEFSCRENLRTFHAALPLEGEFFDDALAYDSNFEASPHKIRGNISVKRLWKDRHRALYARHLESDRFVRMLTANLSWLPDYVGRKLARFSLTPEQDAEVGPPKKTELREIDLSQPVTDKIATALKKRFYETKKRLGR